MMGAGMRTGIDRVGIGMLIYFRIWRGKRGESKR